MGRGSRGFRRKALVGHATALDEVEFAELLDPITPESQFDVTDVPIADEPPIVSRFAAAGLDDNRLPLRAAKRRSLRH
jgi:hypothetical protein